MQKPFAITLDPGSSLANKTGSWRTERPVYVDRLPPCNAQCPAGENIQGWLFHAESGDYEAAWRHLMRDNPFPAIMGRVCYHPCESACNRGQLDAPVGINSVERFLGDEALQAGLEVRPPRRSETGKHVLVVGAGPVGPVGGLPPAPPGPRGHGPRGRTAGRRHDALRHSQVPAAARRARRRDAAHRRRWACKLRARTPRSTTSRDAMQAGGFDAAFLAVGAHIAKRAYIPAKDSSRILDAVSVLRSMEGEDKPMLGRRVVVYGGGNTAIDVARTAKRLGADRGHHRLPPHAREDAGARLRGRGGAARKA